MALRGHTQQQVVAVGSRSAERAAAFAHRFDIPRSYDSYAALVADPQVDAIYVATPHSEHHEHALLAIAAGKHVLVEKAFTRNAAEALEVVQAAEAASVMLMEAMWTRFLPNMDVVRQLLADGALGELGTVLADHGQFFADVPETHRLKNPQLAGGALLDLGIYPVSFAAFVLGEPESVTAHGAITDAGVDAWIAAVLRRGQAEAVVHTTFLAETPTTAVIAGTAGRIEIAGPFYQTQAVRFVPPRGGAAIELPISGAMGALGLCYEAAEFARCVSQGMTSSPLLPPSETVSIMRTLDEIRRQVGAHFPGEPAARS